MHKGGRADERTGEPTDPGQSLNVFLQNNQSPHGLSARPPGRRSARG